jgi:hypothetical protein
MAEEEQNLNEEGLQEASQTQVEDQGPEAAVGKRDWKQPPKTASPASPSALRPW